uniref:Reverse transcriptase domain-containing protein n=1 Tax=Tanacetum cinerariifolium TaxID=118510 RepID=A0A6L2MJL2_TANCI|nr:reverse transcriptase domain-containing protein [Tanacetum cinerariifolium]
MIIDSLLEEFASELAHIELIRPEINFNREEDIRLVEQLLYDNSPLLDALKDHYEIFFDSNDDCTSSDDNPFYSEDIDYVKASPPNSELTSLEEIESLNDNPTPSTNFVLKSPSSFPIPVEDGDFFLEKSKTFLSLPELETFRSDIEEKNSGSTTIHADIYFRMFDTFLPFSFKNEDKVFNPGILASKEDKSLHLLSHRGFKAFQLIYDFSKSPMMLYGVLSYHIEMDQIISLGQKNTLAEYMILSGADHRPPMLDKDLYDSWKSIMELYMQNREHERMILESVEHGPLIWPTVEENGVIRTKKYAELYAAEKIQADCDMKDTNIILQGLFADIYSLVNHHIVAKDLRERVQLVMQEDDLIACLNKEMAFLTAVTSSRRSKQPFILEESPVDTMADQRAMAELLRTPTEGYAEAIVVPLILAEQLKLKHSLINMMTSDQYKDLLRTCPHHGFTELHQLDTFYNAINPADQDSLNSATGGNLLERHTQDVLTIIEKKSKVHNSVNQQTSAVTTAMTAILKQFQATPPPTFVKVIEEICVTCGGAHPFYQCLAADGNTFPELRDNIQGYVSVAAVNFNQGNVLPEKLLDLDSTKDLHPPHHINQLSGSTTSFSSPNHLLKEFPDELALITFPLEYKDDLTFDIESDLKEIEYLLYHDPIKDMDSILEDLIYQSNLFDLNDNLVDTMPKMFIDEHALDYSSPPLYDKYDDDLFEVEFDTEYVYEDPFDSKGEKIKKSKLLIDELDLPSDFLPSSKNDSFLHDDFLRMMLCLRPITRTRSKILLLFSFENAEKVFKPGIHTSKEVHSSLIPELSH